MFISTCKNTVKTLFRSPSFWMVVLVGTVYAVYNEVIVSNYGYVDMATYEMIWDTDPRYILDFQSYIKLFANMSNVICMIPSALLCTVSTAVILMRDYGDRFFEIEKAAGMKPSAYVYGRFVSLTVINTAFHFILLNLCLFSYVITRSGVDGMTALNTFTDGFVRNILTPLVSESSIYICSNMRRMFKEIPTVKPQIMVLVPAILEMILNVSKKFNMDLFKNELHTVIVGGAAMPEYLIFEYNKLGVDIFQGYGMTETSNLVTGNPSPLTKSASVGLIFPYQEVKIIDNELYIKGPNQMVGYYNDEEENKKMMVDGFIKTGDLGYQDEDGYLYLQGRCDDLIILTNGENVSPVKIE